MGIESEVGASGPAAGVGGGGGKRAAGRGKRGRGEGGGRGERERCDLWRVACDVTTHREKSKIAKHRRKRVRRKVDDGDDGWVQH